MNRNRLDAATQTIRDYTRQHPELAAAHHFLYDSPLDKKAGKPEFVIMGINPGETKPDRIDNPEPTEVTWCHDFNANEGKRRSRSSKMWRNHAARFSRCRRIVFAELFFWSSRNGEEFLERFGPIWDSIHLLFCVRMNQLLIEEYQPKAVIVSGLGIAKNAALVFNLEHNHTFRKDYQAKRNVRLIEHYRDKYHPWFFTKHWAALRKTKS
jgi:hypothetical protein